MPQKWPVPVVVVVGVALIIAMATWWTQQGRSRPDTDAVDSKVTGAPGERPYPPSATASPRRTLPVLSLEPGIAPEEQELALRAAQTASAEGLARMAQTQLRAQFEGERVDSAWARRKEQVLEQASVAGQIPELGAEPRSFEVSCRSSTCKMTATFGSRPQADDWFTLFSLNAGADLPNAAVERMRREDGTVQLDIYGFAGQP